MKDIADLIGRIFISLLFIYEALDSLLFFDNTKSTMEDYGVSYYPNILLGTIIFILFLGSILVLIGYYARIGAFLLLVYWLTFTVIVYSFWNDPPLTQRLNALYFMRNIALSGGLLLLIANGAGNYSVKRLIHVMRLPK
ncbi:MAG TPA: DoxX family protein [Saprospiraceae bacterium]|nr:DoxX family protein [Saprospiraceae bacterium]